MHFTKDALLEEERMLRSSLEQTLENQEATPTISSPTTSEDKTRIQALQKQLEIATQASTQAFSEQREASSYLRNLKRQVQDLTTQLELHQKRQETLPYMLPMKTQFV